MSVQICCEGPLCNNGISAEMRESAALIGLPRGGSEADRLLYAKEARATTSQQLKVTPHEQAGKFRRGTVLFDLFACKECGHERIYGNADSLY